MIKVIKGLLILIATCFGTCSFAQTCTTIGQNPETAFPICGDKIFSQSEVKLCGNKTVPGPCDADNVTDQNPYWYKFTCFKSGSLGFIITPIELSDDYDWQLFDITDRNAQDVYTDRDLFVACNWSGEPGVTGASSEGRSLSVCAGFGKDLFSTMPQLVEGHQYLLLISHFTNTQSGYKLEIKGGTAEITDTKTPEMLHVVGDCSGDRIGVKLNKKMKCSSLAADGSDFELAGNVANVTGASAPSCSGFDTDSIVLILDRTLSPGDYTVLVKKGTDDNTLLDICDTEMDPGSKAFTVYLDVSATFTHELRIGCIKDTLLAAHDGDNEVNYWSWTSDGVPFSNHQNASNIYTTPGDKNVTLIVSNGHCNDTSTITISLSPKLDAAFEAPEIVCAKDKTVFINKSTGNISQWSWNFGEGRTSRLQNPDPFNYTPPPGERIYRVTLSISDPAGCTDTASANIIVVSNCTIVVPTAFTPNNDGRNDYLYPSNAFNAENLIFRVFNRFGQQVFETRDWRRKWDGTFNGNPQPSGTYVWTLNYVLRTTKAKFSLKGATVLIR